MILVIVQAYKVLVHKMLLTDIFGEHGAMLEPFGVVGFLPRCCMYADKSMFGMGGGDGPPCWTRLAGGIGNWPVMCFAHAI